jgi:hypothetical protein
LSEQWKESITAPTYMQNDKTNCSNYQGKLLLATTHNILSNILLTWLTPYADNIIKDHQCEIQHSQINKCQSNILHLSHTGEKIAVQWNGISAINILPEGLWYS